MSEHKYMISDDRAEPSSIMLYNILKSVSQVAFRLVVRSYKLFEVRSQRPDCHVAHMEARGITAASPGTWNEPFDVFLSFLFCLTLLHSAAFLWDSCQFSYQSRLFMWEQNMNIHEWQNEWEILFFSSVSLAFHCKLKQ